MRLAKGMGLHREASLAKQTPFEAELRRRLWWALVLFDTRKCEMSDCKDVELAPTWDCRVPLNIGDSDLFPEMKERPKDGKSPTEALFPILRAEFCNTVRYSSFYLDFTNPLFKALLKNPSENNIRTSEEKIEKEYLQNCDSENALHFFTIWAIRGQIAKFKLLEYYTKPILSDSQRDEGLELAFYMLKADTEVANHPGCKAYTWFVQSYFPFPGYIHIIQDIRRRPRGKLVGKAWEVMKENYDFRFPLNRMTISPLSKMFCKTCLTAWGRRPDCARRRSHPATIRRGHEGARSPHRRPGSRRQ